MSRPEIGLRQARLLCQMKHGERLDFIAEGLPSILDSARGFWNASQQLKDAPREAGVLEGHAEEEAAKILILMDIVRCPQKRAASRVGAQAKWFYDHLARLIYAKAVSWKPMHVTQLQEYIDGERKAHYVEGDFGEYIMQNWETYSRENRLYVDIEAQEGGVRVWSVPQTYNSGILFDDLHIVRVAEALSALGVFAPKGLRTVADIWGQIEFADSQGSCDSRSLTRALLERLDREGLLTDAAEDHHVNTLYNIWQMPMYNLDFSIIEVSREELERQRDNIFYAEVGDGY